MNSVGTIHSMGYPLDSGDVQKHPTLSQLHQRWRIMIDPTNAPSRTPTRPNSKQIFHKLFRGNEEEKTCELRPSQDVPWSKTSSAYYYLVLQSKPATPGLRKSQTGRVRIYGRLLQWSILCNGLEDASPLVNIFCFQLCPVGTLHAVMRSIKPSNKMF